MPPHDPDRPFEPGVPRRPFDWGAPNRGPAAELDYDPDTVPVVHPIELLHCGRCGETAEPVRGKCPWCGAWTAGDPPKPPRARPVRTRRRRDGCGEDDEFDRRAERRRRDRAGHYGAVAPAIPVRRPYLIPPVVTVSVAYFGLLASLVGCAVVSVLAGLAAPDEVTGAQALAGVVTTALTLAALAMVWSAARQKVPEGTALLAWFGSLPVLCVLLCMNLVFFELLRELVRTAGAPEPGRMKFTLITVLLICVQPAVVEELFFRQMALGVLRRHMNVHLAIWVTGAVFALAHLGNIIGMPYLFLVGAFLGYARVYGGLTLAMVLHFLHNLAVVAYDACRPLG